MSLGWVETELEPLLEISRLRYFGVLLKRVCATCSADVKHSNRRGIGAALIGRAPFSQ
jgi:hypothetical protein